MHTIPFVFYPGTLGVRGEVVWLGSGLDLWAGQAETFHQYPCRRWANNATPAVTSFLQRAMATEGNGLRPSTLNYITTCTLATKRTFSSIYPNGNVEERDRSRQFRYGLLNMTRPISSASSRRWMWELTMKKPLLLTKKSSNWPILYLRDDLIQVKIVLATVLMAIARKVIILNYQPLEPMYIFAAGVVLVCHRNHLLFRS